MRNLARNLTTCVNVYFNDSTLLLMTCTGWFTKESHRFRILLRNFFNNRTKAQSFDLQKSSFKHLRRALNILTLYNCLVIELRPLFWPCKTCHSTRKNISKSNFKNKDVNKQKLIAGNVRENLPVFGRKVSCNNDRKSYVHVYSPDKQLFLVIHPPRHHGGSCKMENHDQNLDRSDRMGAHKRWHTWGSSRAMCNARDIAPPRCRHRRRRCRYRAKKKREIKKPQKLESEKVRTHA